MGCEECAAGRSGGDAAAAVSEGRSYGSKKLVA